MLKTVSESLKAHWALWLLGAAIVIHLLMMASLFWGYLNPFFSDSDSLPQGTDFFAIYEAGRSAAENRSLYSYDFFDTSVTPYHQPYRYIPFFAYAFAVPVNALPPWWAYWGWVTLYELLLVANAYATWRIAGRGRWALIGAGMWFVFTPFYLEQYMGQFSFLMATMLFWVGIGVVRGREAVAGLPWLVSLVTKSNSAVLAPLFLRLGWWRSLVGGALLLSLNVPYFIARPDDLELFYRANFPGLLSGAEQQFAAFQPGDLGAVAFIRNSLLTLEPASTGVPVALLLATGVVGCSLAATFLARKFDALALFAIWISAFFLFYDDVWEHHYVMLLPVLVLLVAFRPSVRPWALLVFVFVALPTPYLLLTQVWGTRLVPDPAFYTASQEAWPAWGVVLHHAAKPVPVFALWAYLTASQLREGLDLQWLSTLRDSLWRPAWLRSSR